MDLNNIILFFFLIGFSLFFYKYILTTFYKYYPKFLVDDEFSKPQAFHESPISISGGLLIFSLLLITIFYILLSKSIFFLEYLSICTFFFALGFVDDLRINIKPTIRLVLMFIILAFLLKFNNFYFEKTGIEILNKWLSGSEIFSLIFITLCFLFVVNGANLIDGYNGLLGMHSLLILLNLFLINYLNQNSEIANFLFFSILILAIFLYKNFPRAEIFLGDSGSYLLGGFVAISAIKTSILSPTISPFYFCILLFYLFFEVFFSFFRKLIKDKTSPMHPDKKHLHMLLYKVMLAKDKNKLKSNYYVSIIINSIYFLLVLPAVFMMNNGVFCKYYSIVLFFVYIFSYQTLNKKLEKSGN